METHSLKVDLQLDLALKQRTIASRDPRQVQQDRDQAEQFRQEMLAKYGVRDLAVQLVREIRDVE